MFLRNVKFTVGIHDDSTSTKHTRTPNGVDEKCIESLLNALAVAVKQHISTDSYVIVTYEKELGIKVNS